MNPLAFPKNPYHKLIKHYQSGQLIKGERNNPLADAKLVVQVLIDQYQALKETLHTNPDLLTAWHWLTTRNEKTEGFNQLFQHIRQSNEPTQEEAKKAIANLLLGMGCDNESCRLLEISSSIGWPLAYALAWLSVSGGNSVIPPWVRKRFPDTTAIIKKLRDISCQNPSCTWCAERHNATQELRRWFSAS